MELPTPSTLFTQRHHLARFCAEAYRPEHVRPQLSRTLRVLKEIEPGGPESLYKLFVNAEQSAKVWLASPGGAAGWVQIWGDLVSLAREETGEGPLRTALGEDIRQRCPDMVFVLSMESSSTQREHPTVPL
mmetsp:Transcript_61461/g.133548  ORF Transcript_61461/g.133548 Transcript_61461/m.133548 type:complete len:131 (-) Transcript_61461:10-402(-)